MPGNESSLLMSLSRDSGIDYEYGQSTSHTIDDLDPSKNVTLAAAVDTAAKLASPPEKLHVARRSLPPLSMHHRQWQNSVRCMAAADAAVPVSLDPQLIASSCRAKQSHLLFPLTACPFSLTQLFNQSAECRFCLSGQPGSAEQPAHKGGSKIDCDK